MSDVEITKLSKDIQRGFVDINRRFDAADKNSNSFDKKFDAIDKRFDDIDKKFDVVDKKFDAIDKRFDNVDKKFDAIDKRFDTADKRTDNIDRQLDKLTKLVIKGFGNIDKVLETKANTTDIQNIFKILDDLSQRLEITEDERLVMASQLTQLHDWVERAAKRIDIEFIH